MHYEILDAPRREILPRFAPLKGRFYLAGGTALALEIGHRDSIDFDFFSPKPVNTPELYSELESVLEGHKILKTQEEKNTLSLLVDNSIRVSFFSYPYPLIKPLIEEEHLSLASVEDIACMKLSAITGRSVEKDYVDLFFILKQISLKDLLSYSVQKHPALDTNLILKSLVYFDDVVREPIRFTSDSAVSFEDVQSYLRNTVRSYQQQ
jgi:hypothetical protein